MLQHVGDKCLGDAAEPKVANSLPSWQNGSQVPIMYKYHMGISNHVAVVHYHYASQACVVSRRSSSLHFMW